MQTKEIVFTTGNAPDYIPHHNIAYAYPIINQLCFLPGESTNGYITLKQGQPYLFASESSFFLEGDWVQKVVLTQGSETVGMGDISYNNTTKSINFAIPSGLTAGEITQIELRNIPSDTSTTVDANVTETQTDLATDDEFSTILVKEKTITEAAVDEKEKEFYTAHFRTSLYNSFADKMNALDLSDDFFLPIWLDDTRASALTINNFGIYAKGDELFDLFDQDGYHNGIEWVDPLIQLEANLEVTGDDWYDTKIEPNMYSFLPSEDIFVRWRNSETLGGCTSQAVRIVQLDDAPSLTADDLTMGTASPPKSTTNISYELPYTMLRDKFEFDVYVADHLVSNPSASQELVDYLEWLFIYPNYGDYEVNAKYVLPDKLQRRPLTRSLFHMEQTIRHMDRVFFIAALMLAASLSGKAQDTLIDLDHALKVTARAGDSSIKLRWAPTTNYTWRHCIENGVVLYRYTVSRDGKVLPFAERSREVVLTTEPIRPWAGQDQWRELMQRDDYAAVGAQAIYGGDFSANAVEQSPEAQPKSIIEEAWQQQNRFGFGLFAADHSWDAAVAMGLAFEDQEIEDGEYYLYRIAPATMQAEEIDTGLVSIRANDNFSLPKPLELTASFGDQAATLKWNHRMFDQFYISYWVERSVDGVNFSRRNDRPLINVSPTNLSERSEYIFYLDSLPNNGTPFFYRVQGNNSFGETGPFSDIVQGMGINPVSQSHPEILAVIPSEQSGLTIRWQYPEFMNNAILGFRVLRAPKDQGPFSDLIGGQLLDSEVRSFDDVDPLPSNYYIVEAVDAFNRTIPSYSALGQLDDSIPPAAPEKLRGKILLDGTLVVTWDENLEDDLLGYRVYAANDPNAEFSQITSGPVTTNYFIDTVSLRSLSELYFVKVMALDYRHNPSELSEMATVQKPDTIPPSAAVMVDLRSDSTGIFMEWASSSAHDLTRQVLLRRERGAEPWDTLSTFTWPEDMAQETYYDDSADPSTHYQYAILAIDDAGLSEISDEVNGKRIDNFIRKKIKEVGASANHREKNIELVWKYEEMERIKQFVIYKSTSDRLPISYETLSSDQAMFGSGKKGNVYSFVDEGVKLNTEYKYKIKAIYQDGGESPLSEDIVVNY